MKEELQKYIAEKRARQKDRFWAGNREDCVYFNNTPDKLKQCTILKEAYCKRQAFYFYKV